MDQKVHDKPLRYLDNAASTQKPERVIEAISRYYRKDHANVHRGVHQLSQRSTALFESARNRVASFLGVKDPAQIIFTKGCTEAINLVASILADGLLNKGDRILCTGMEHHANIVPWQIAAERKRAKVEPILINPQGKLDYKHLEDEVGKGCRLVAVKHVCNATGVVNDVKRVAEIAHKHDALVLVDGAQAPAHMAIDMEEIQADFYAISGHKVFGPTGIGALYGQRDLLDTLPPYQGGGDMIRKVSFAGTTFNSIPNKYEAGTPNIAGAIGLAEALDFVESVGFEHIQHLEKELTKRMVRGLRSIEGVTLYGDVDESAGIVSFNIDGVHPHDAGTILDTAGVAVRTGHHCCQPLMGHLGVNATIRASLALYNEPEEVDALVEGVRTVKEMFA
ncbi:MAG: aminotransferase class V-fold PLP-dependent enzyme [Fimbriimonadaceae bacterium]